jgi:hypothetical protein
MQVDGVAHLLRRAKLAAEPRGEFLADRRHAVIVVAVRAHGPRSRRVISALIQAG